MNAHSRWALVLCLAVLMAATAMQASASYEFTYTTLGDPYLVEDASQVYGPPPWWNVADDNTLSLQLNPVSVGGVNYGYGIAPGWWIPTADPVEGETYPSDGWAWSGDFESSTTLWIKNREQPDMFKEIWIWWQPTEMTGHAQLLDHVRLDTATEVGRKADLLVWDAEQKTAFAKWIIEPQPDWETITWYSCSHPSCDLFVAVRCAPGLPAFALVGVAPVLGMLIRRRRG